MKAIDEAKLESDIGYRYAYVAEFMGFGESDVEILHAAAEHLGPLVPSLVDAVYEKLFSYDATKRHFLPKQDGYDGPLAGDLESLTLDADVIKFRKQHLGRYLETLVTKPYDGKMVQYLDAVGRIHTPKLGSSAINVPLVQMNALMGFVADALIATVFGLELPQDVEQRAIRAVNKLLWIQNDLITRHYADAAEPAMA